MFDSSAQDRFNKSCTDAVVNYLNASGAAYQAVAGQMLRVWGQSVDAFIEQSQQTHGRSTSRTTNPYNLPTAPRGSASCMMPWAALPSAMTPSNPFASFTPFGVPYGMFTPMAPWMEMMKPFQSTAFPMAVGMISFGVPEQVAWPAARGNAAALDAYNIAANSMEKALSDYRREQERTPTKVQRIEHTEVPNPFTLAFAIMPFNPDMLMKFFAPQTERKG